jgi:DNA-binding NtrC family response regulator
MSPNKPSVLVVDDQESWRTLLVDLLEDKFTVDTASNYQEALRKVQKQRPPFHVIISDIRLKDDDKTNEQGLDFLAKVDGNHMPIESIVLTGYATIPTVKRALKDLDVFEYLEKVPNNNRFDRDRFSKIVSDAAQIAMQDRSEIMSRISPQVLIIDNDLDLLDVLSAILHDDGFIVESCADIDNLPEILGKQMYGLILLNVDLVADDPQLIYRIREYQRNIQIILSSSSIKIPFALEMVREKNVYGVILIADPFDELHFRRTVWGALAKSSEFYAVVRYQNSRAEKSMVLNQNYRLTISLQNKPDPRGILMRRVAKSSATTTIRIIIYAQDMKVGPGEEISLEISPNQKLDPITISVTPQAIGEKSITFDFEEGDIWLGRWSNTVEIVR